MPDHDHPSRRKSSPHHMTKRTVALTGLASARAHAALRLSCLLRRARAPTPLQCLHSALLRKALFATPPQHLHNGPSVHTSIPDIAALARNLDPSRAS